MVNLNCDKCNRLTEHEQGSRYWLCKDCGNPSERLTLFVDKLY